MHNGSLNSWDFCTNWLMVSRCSSVPKLIRTLQLPNWLILWGVSLLHVFSCVKKQVASQESVVTSGVKLIDYLHILDDMWAVTHDVVNFVSDRIVWSAPCPFPFRSFLEECIHDC